MPVTKCQNATDGSRCAASPVRRVLLSGGDRPYYCHDCEARLVAAGADIRSAATRGEAVAQTAAETAAERMASRLGDSLPLVEDAAWRIVGTAPVLRTLRGAAARTFGTGAETFAHGVDNAIDATVRSLIRRMADRLEEVPSTVGLAAQWVAQAPVVEGKRGDRMTNLEAAIANATRRKAMLGRIDGIMAGGRIPWEGPDGTVSRTVEVAVEGSGQNAPSAEAIAALADRVLSRCRTDAEREEVEAWLSLPDAAQRIATALAPLPLPPAPPVDTTPPATVPPASPAERTALPRPLRSGYGALPDAPVRRLLSMIG